MNIAADTPNKSRLKDNITKPIKHFDKARTCHTSHHRLDEMRKTAVTYGDLHFGTLTLKP